MAKTKKRLPHMEVFESTKLWIKVEAAKRGLTIPEFIELMKKNFKG